MSNDLKYFHNSFDEMKASLRKILKCHPDCDHHQISESWTGNLPIDLIHFEPESRKNTLIVINSGLHGIEGYTGGALQEFFLDHYLKDVQNWSREEWGLLLIHTLNPWGTQNFRRVNQDNIDLNRHFVEKTQRPYNHPYDKLKHHLCPQKKLHLKRSSHLSFQIRSLPYMLTMGYQNLKQATLQGQYHHSQGLYYGGEEEGPYINFAREKLLKLIAPYKKVIFIDLHTGYGPRGELILMRNHEIPENLHDHYQQLFYRKRIYCEKEGEHYTVQGDFIQFLERNKPSEQDFYSVVFEFGTVNNHQVINSFSSLWAMVCENQTHFYGCDNSSLLPVKKAFQELFYPSSERWRAQVLCEFKKTIDEMLLKLASFGGVF